MEVYLPKDPKEEAATCVEEPRRLRQLVREITGLKVELIRPHRCRRAKALRQGLALETALAQTLAYF